MNTEPPASSTPAALAGIRICDFCGQLAGAGATRWLAAFGAEVIRIEDPVREGRWDILRGIAPFVDDRRGIDLGGAFNNHNVEKRGITLNLRTERGKALLVELIRQSDCVTENFAAGVLERLGFGYERLKEIRPDIIYVSNSGFGQTGPYASFKSWGPIVQAVSGLTFASGLPDLPPAGWGYAFMDHTGGHYMAIAILLALIHRQRTGEGQWVDLACTEAGLTLHGPALLDWTVNHRPTRRAGQPHSNRSEWPPMAPHGIYRCAGGDDWIAIACRDEDDWRSFAGVVSEAWVADPAYATLEARLQNQSDLDAAVTGWCGRQGKFEAQRRLRAVSVPASAVQKPSERIDDDPDTEDLWPTVTHAAIGEVRVDGLPARFSGTPWRIVRGAPRLGEHNEEVFGRLLGLGPAELAALREEGVI